MLSEICIRPAVEGDAPAIQQLIAALAHETLGPDKEVLTVSEVRRYGFGEEKSFDAIVAEKNGTVVAAMVLYDEFSTWRGQKGVYVLDIYIAREARGGGLGKRMISFASNWALQRGASYVRLSVDVDNAPAIGFYESIGFREGAHDRVFILEGAAFDAMIGK